MTEGWGVEGEEDIVFQIGESLVPILAGSIRHMHQDVSSTCTVLRSQCLSPNLKRWLLSSNHSPESLIFMQPAGLVGVFLSGARAILGGLISFRTATEISENDDNSKSSTNLLHCTSTTAVTGRKQPCQCE